MKDKIKGSVNLLPYCKYCGSSNRFFRYDYFKILSLKVKLFCDDCHYETRYYKKEVEAIKEWIKKIGDV